MKLKISAGLGITEDEAYSDYYRCSNEDPFIQDYVNERWIFYKIGYIERGGKSEHFEEEFKRDMLKLIEKQNNEIWVTGHGYLDKKEVTLWTRFTGYLKKLFTFRIWIYKEQKWGDDLPF